MRSLESVLASPHLWSAFVPLPMRPTLGILARDRKLCLGWLTLITPTYPFAHPHSALGSQVVPFPLREEPLSMIE